MISPPYRAVVTTGSFDGVHHGHRVLLKEVKRRAQEISGESIVVTFSPHPRCVLKRGGDIKLLNTLDEKILLLEEFGIDVLLVLPFNEEFAELSSESYVRDILRGVLDAKYMVVGYDHRFGRDGASHGTELQRLGKESGFEVCVVERQDIGESKVSSTVIRNMIESGDIEKANSCLSRPYIMLANINEGYITIDNPAKLLPASGIYNVRVSYGKDSDVSKDTLTISGQGAVRLNGDSRGEGQNVLIEFLNRID